MNFLIENGLMFMEQGNKLYIPAIEDMKEEVDLDKKTFTSVFQEVEGNFEINARVIPENISFTDSFEIYVDDGFTKGYLKQDVKCGKCRVFSGINDMFNMENEKHFLDSDDICIKLIKKYGRVETYVSTDGNEYIYCGHFKMDSDKVKIGFKAESFQGNNFMVKVENLDFISI